MKFVWAESGNDRRERTVRSVLKGQSVLWCVRADCPIKIVPAEKDGDRKANMPLARQTQRERERPPCIKASSGLSYIIYVLSLKQSVQTGLRRENQHFLFWRAKRLREYHSAVGGGKMWELWAESAANLLKVHCILIWVSNIKECFSMTFLLFHGTGDWKEKTRQTAWRLRFVGRANAAVCSFLPSEKHLGARYPVKDKEHVRLFGSKVGFFMPRYSSDVLT